MSTISFIVPSERKMLQLGERLAHACFAANITKCVIYLHGDLGAGKTTLVRGFLRGSGYTQAVKSPTYTIVEPYSANDKTIYHFDLYRLVNAEELAYIGANDYFGADAICLIEWAEHGTGFIPAADLLCSLSHDATSAKRRLVVIEGKSEVGKKLIVKKQEKSVRQ